MAERRKTDAVEVAQDAAFGSHTTDCSNCGEPVAARAAVQGDRGDSCCDRCRREREAGLAEESGGWN